MSELSEVHKARSRKNGAIVALKKILMHNEKDGFPITALREIKLLKMLSHVNILRLEEMAVERNKGEGRKKAVMYMVTPYMDHDLSGLLENPDVDFTEPQIKCYMIQLLKGLRFLHDKKILHRDMKAANLLINNQGILQIADFGLARPYDDEVPQPGKGGGEATRDYTTLVVTRWYRPPELLLQLRRYTTAIDMWGVGCVFGEMFKGKPILAGNSDLNQLQMVFDLVGSPTEETMPGWTSLPGCEGVKSFKPRLGTLAQVFREQGSSAISLLSELLKLDWRKRINAIDAMQHPYFKNNPLPANPGELPRFEDSHELDRRKFRGQKAALPPAPAGGTVGMGSKGDWVNSSGSSSKGAYVNGHGPQISGGQGGVGSGGGGGFQGLSGAMEHKLPRNGYDGRVPNMPHQSRTIQPPVGTSAHRPAWDRSGLPPKPPPTHQAWGGQGWANEAHADGRGPKPLPSRAPAVGAGGVWGDTYIPSYAGGGDSLRARDDGGRREERGDRGQSGDRRFHDHTDYSRRRSRSPDRNRDRERTRDRDRDLYRR
ncbi:serine/threonine protein kinase, CMGC, CDC2/CDK sub [Acarospora aff. strigata]|nr:serine/threonine protein kinase, CMGC, CDC2/CDK sub [Acarospora aff. strigata]